MLAAAREVAELFSFAGFAPRAARLERRPEIRSSRGHAGYTRRWLAQNGPSCAWRSEERRVGKERGAASDGDWGPKSQTALNREIGNTADTGNSVLVKMQEQRGVS